MPHYFARRVLVALATAVATAVLAPVASAAITPTLVLTPNSVPAGAVNQNLEMNFGFTGDTPKTLTVALPPGLLDDASINGGACVTSSTPVAACQVASGTATVGALTPSVTMDLVKPPTTGDVAGLALNVTGLGVVSTGDITVRPAGDPAGVGLSVAFAGLPAGVTGLDVHFTGIRTPASCPATPATVGVSVTGQTAGNTGSVSTPLTVTGCSALPYAPKFAAAGTKDSADSGVEILTTVTQAASEATSKSVAIKIPSNVAPNLVGAVGLLCAAPNATFSNCTQVGLASAVTPLLPAKLTGAVYLTGTLTQPQLTVAFSSPFALQFSGAVSITGNSVTFSNVPDVPLTNLQVLLTGGSKALFQTTCNPATATAAATFVDQNGDKTVPATAPFTIAGCSAAAKPGVPTGSGSVSGVSHGKPKLSAKLTAGNNGGPKLSAVTFKLPSGLSFVKAGLKKGVTVSGGKIKSASLSGGKLAVTLKSAASSFTVKVGSSALKASSSLVSKVKKHKVKTLKLTAVVKEATGASATVTITLKVS